MITKKQFQRLVETMYLVAAKTVRNSHEDITFKEFELQQDKIINQAWPLIKESEIKEPDIEEVLAETPDPVPLRKSDRE